MKLAISRLTAWLGALTFCAFCWWLVYQGALGLVNAALKNAER